MKKLRKTDTIIFILKIILILLTAVYPLTFVTLSGAGLVLNRESYGESLCITGILLIASGGLMTAGAVLCCLRKNLVSAVCSLSGFGLCMAMFIRLAEHADRCGWTVARTLQPVSDMYRDRLLPAAFPVALTVIIAAVQHFFPKEKQ